MQSDLLLKPLQTLSSNLTVLFQVLQLSKFPFKAEGSGIMRIDILSGK